MRRRQIGVVMVLCCLLAPAPLSARDDDTLRVLFIGNSHTYVNDLPGMFHSLSESGSRVAIVDMSAPGGYALMEHVTNPTTLDKIARPGWDFVALQEQSQIPTIEYWRENGMYPASRTLDSLVRLPGAGTAFYMTWGWKLGGTMTYRGHSSPEFRDYFHMQDSTTAAYRRIARELSARMVPVGSAWAIARRRDSLVDLWQTDNCHATVKGTYLAACVFYAALWEADPRGLSYAAGLNPEDAQSLQQAAWEAVSGISEHVITPRSAPAVRAVPNPFSSNVRISCSLPASSRPAVTIFDATGRLIRTLFNDRRTPGPQDILWNGRDHDGDRVRPGIYFCKLQAADRVARIRLVKAR